MRAASVRGPLVGPLSRHARLSAARLETDARGLDALQRHGKGWPGPSRATRRSRTKSAPGTAVRKQPDPSLAAHEKGLTTTPDRRGASERIGEPYRATGGPKEPCEGLQWVCSLCRSGPAGGATTRRD